MDYGIYGEGESRGWLKYNAAGWDICAWGVYLLNHITVWSKNYVCDMADNARVTIGTKCPFGLSTAATDALWELYTETSSRVLVLLL